MKNWLISLFKTYFVRLFPLILVFLASLYHPSDSDLGWHLKYGQYFVNHLSVLRKNIYSSEMIGYKWVNHSWATDIFTYITFNNFGFWGLSVAGALVMVFTFYFFQKAAKLSFWQTAFVFPIMLFLEDPLTIVSFRSQLLSLLGLGVLYFLLSKYEDGRKKLIFITLPLFLLWSNLHGEFILGLAVFSVWILFHLARQKLTSTKNIKEIINEEKIIISAFFGAIFATLINPFGIGIYQEIIRHFGNPFQKYIIEWTPLDKFSPLWWILVIWGAVILINLVILKLKKQLTQFLPYIGILLILYLLSFWMRRYAWPMYLLSIPVTSYLFKILTPANKKFSSIIATCALLLLYFYLVMIKIPYQQLNSMSWSRYCLQYVRCSPESAEFLKKQKFTGNLLTFYNWGGWLIWNYPEIKPSMDGRMPFWKDEKGYSAFAEYYPLEQNWKEVDKSKYDIVYITPSKPIHKQMMKLVEEKKWKIAYQDEYAFIFVRLKSS